MKALRIESASHPSNLLTLSSNNTHSRVPLVYSTLTRITENCSPLLLSRTSRVYCTVFAYLVRKVKIWSTVLLNMPHFYQENQSQITVNWDLLCVKIKSVHEYALSQAIMRLFSTFFILLSFQPSTPMERKLLLDHVLKNNSLHLNIYKASYFMLRNGLNWWYSAIFHRIL